MPIKGLLNRTGQGGKPQASPESVTMKRLNHESLQEAALHNAIHARQAMLVNKYKPLVEVNLMTAADVKDVVLTDAMIVVMQKTLRDYYETHKPPVMITWIEEANTITPEMWEALQQTIPYSEAKMIPVTFTNAKKYDRRSIDELKVGDIVMNAYHDPESPAHNAGLYMVIADPAAAKAKAKHTYLDADNIPFVVNIRSGLMYNYNYMRSRTSNNAKSGVYMVDVESYTVSVRRAVRTGE